MTAAHAPERVLSTLNEDGSRFKIYPKTSRGRFHRARAFVAYGLIAVFVLLPYLELGGKPAILLDLARRDFTFFGATFRPADGFILMLFGLSVALTVFLVTALAGRVWCGWGCPQTVYMEWIFRPIERFFEGSASDSRKLDEKHGLSWRRLGKWSVYLGLAFLLANTFLAYFVSARTVWSWTHGSPAVHPVGFTIVAGVTAAVFLDFAWFREQMCIIACPYGRLQSVLLDQQSLIVGYDVARGEPRGKAKGGKRAKLPVVGEGMARTADVTGDVTAGGARLGDCVDCNACVATCPTGIDIRKGLQMECIGCAQCVDACDAIMGKLGRAPGLIRYTSKAQLAGQPRRLLRPRTMIYPALLGLAFVLFLTQLRHRTEADVWLLRQEGAPFTELADGTVSTPVRVKIENRSSATRTYTLTVHDVPEAKVVMPRPSYQLAPGKPTVLPIFIESPQGSFRHGERSASIEVSDDHGWHRTLGITVLGPEHTPEGATP
ncbi:MAG TPA: cytochrome c oxidase accessory protein CcoG [Kofleriaceae bacterium]|nr:cytochrome c oxidase accessory protein CcoG [Kofleriaceae bacterium]